MSYQKKLYSGSFKDRNIQTDNNTEENNKESNYDSRTKQQSNYCDQNDMRNMVNNLTDHTSDQLFIESKLNHEAPEWFPLNQMIANNDDHYLNCNCFDCQACDEIDEYIDDEENLIAHDTWFPSSMNCNVCNGYAFRKGVDMEGHFDCCRDCDKSGRLIDVQL